MHDIVDSERKAVTVHIASKLHTLRLLVSSEEQLLILFAVSYEN